MIFNRALRTAAGLAIVMGAVAAHPAIAKDAPASTTAATTQLSGAINGSVAGPLGQGDKEFTQLFASWKQLDGSARNIAGTPRQAVSVPSVSPVQGFRLTSGFGNREHPILGGIRMHEGVDLAVPSGTPIYAPADGLVEMAQRFGSYGNFIKIMHGGEMETRYGHLSAYNVAAGQYVHKGDVIGYVGSTGRATGPHLHYEVRIDGHAVDPMPYLSLGQVAVAADPSGASDAD
ncbi:MAG TPA: M23 family metallopeptidase [Croceibacterium sp.]|jgi:murein DD-endopeptidase MepM/ murein hydrolase activator NlpD